MEKNSKPCFVFPGDRGEDNDSKVVDCRDISVSKARDTDYIKDCEYSSDEDLFGNMIYQFSNCYGS